MRVLRVAAAAIDARLRRPEAHRRMKCERLHSILQQQSNIRENAFEFAHKLLGFEFVFVKRIGAGLRASLRVVAFVRRRDDEQAFAREHARAFIEKRAIVGQMFDHFERDHQHRTIPPGRELPCRTIRRSANPESDKLRVGIFDRVRRDVHAGHLSGGLREFGRSVAGAATCIQHALAFARSGERTRSAPHARSKGRRSPGPELPALR